MIRIINISSAPIEWTFDSENFGPLAPGEVWEGEDKIAEHAIKKNLILNDEGIPVGSKATYLENALQHPEYKKMIQFRCPWVDKGECDQRAIKGHDDLLRHIATSHATRPPKVL